MCLDFLKLKTGLCNAVLQLKIIRDIKNKITFSQSEYLEQVYSRVDVIERSVCSGSALCALNAFKRKVYTNYKRSEPVSLCGYL